MKILNLYAGIGGNRKLWGDDHEITAVEYKQEIADIYHDFFPNDTIVVDDAHRYLLEHYKKFDFIWSSPPCPSHSQVRFIAMGREKYPQKPLFPDMKLYEEVIFLQKYFKGNWCVENVIGYYEPLIKPTEMENHYWWTNFHIRHFTTNQNRAHYGTIEELQERKGFDLTKYKIEKRTILRNCVEPEIGKHILDCAINESQERLWK